MTAIGTARQLFLQELDGFERLAEAVSETIADQTRGSGIPCSVSARVKTLESFVGKAIRKGYRDPWLQITDKVGVRVTVDEAADIDRVVALVRAKFEVIEFQDKTRELWGDDRIGYGGVHVQIASPADHVGGGCEIQVRTAAQNLWSDMSHRLLYKPGIEPPNETKRALTRLAALMEIFDEEVERSVQQILALPGFPVESLINVVEPIFYRFSASSYDRSLSRFVLSGLPLLKAMWSSSDFAQRLAAWSDEQSDKLRSIFDRYPSGVGPVLVGQPESILLFYLLSTDPFTLEAEWSLPDDEFTQLRAIWGGS